MYGKCVITIFLIFLASFSCEKDKDSDSKEVFLPTKDWKVIKEGQKVPSGLHYRINLSTGKKEAKINDNSASDASKSFLLVNQDDTTNGPSEEVENILKEVNKKTPETEMPKKFRTLDEIKKDLDSLNITPKTDAEVISDLFTKFETEEKKKNQDDETMLSILEDLVYLSHQYDNGNEFVRLDGFNKIIYKSLNSTKTPMKQVALKLFSSLVQNNSKVKVHALETGGITTLLRIFNLDLSPHVKSSAVTALGCLLRTFPYAQNSFLELGGLNIYSELFQSSSIKLKLKLVILLHDLILERRYDKINFENYSLIDLEEALFKLNWCDHLNQLLYDLSNIDIDDHDSIEKCLISMESMKEKCGSFYKKDVVSNLQRNYENLASKDEDSTSSYFKMLGELCTSLTNSTSSQDEHSVKVEL